MLLCEVALGNSEDVLNSRIGESAQLDVTQYQSRHAHGRQIPDPRYTITRNYGIHLLISIELLYISIFYSRC